MDRDLLMTRHIITQGKNDRTRPLL